MTQTPKRRIGAARIDRVKSGTGEEPYAPSAAARFRSCSDANRSNKEEAVTHGNFAWHELYTRDVEAAKAFYGATVG